MVRKKHKPIPEQRRAKKTPSTRRNSSDSAASEEPPEVTEMDIPLPASPHASRPGTPEKDGTAQLHCKKLQELANLIQVLSISIETSQTILQGVVSKGLTDPTNPIIQMESSALERNNTRLQCAVSEYTSLPPCGIPNCSRHDTQNTPLKPKTPDPTTPIQIKRYVSITVEGFESRGVIQCFQCNQFNHTAEHCNLTPKCLKCGDKYQTRDCQIKKLDTPFCVNCQVHGHMANYSKCSLFPKPRKGANIKSNPILTNNFISPNISYAQVTQKTNHSDTTQQMAPLVTAPIDTPTIKEIPTPTFVPTQIPNTQTDCLNLITQTLQQTIHALTTLVQHISLITSPQTVTAQPTPGPTKITSKSPLTKSQIIAQINNLLNHYDVALRKKTNLSRHTRPTEGSRRLLWNMTEEEWASVRERNGLNTIQIRHTEPKERRAVRLEDARLQTQ
ncbi:PRE_C2HC domain-containing protein [Trichonephila clavipes]|nr:PRE_C2HC domain-containing protein [Trichonephila clavipes]